MPAKKLSAKTTGEVGAPAAAKRLEGREADVWGRIERLEDDLGKTDVLLAQADGDTEEQEKLSKKIERINKDLLATYKLWFELTKQVREFDKSVSEQRRDGEKILRADVEQLLVNTWRFQRIGREKFIVSISQEAIRCKDEQDFYSKFANPIRERESDSLKDGIEHEKFPAWVLECYEKAL